MKQLTSYVAGEWKAGTGTPRRLSNAVTGEPIASCSSEGIDLGAMLRHAREKGGPALRMLTFPERAEILKKMAAALNEHVKELREIAATYGATPADARMDVDGGIATLGYYGSLGAKRLPASRFLVDGALERLSKPGNFAGLHVYLPREGAAVQINAHNFPSWGMLEKFAPSLLAGMPSIVKPATPSALLAHRMAEILIGSGVLPEGSLQILCGGSGGLLDHLDSQDVVSFTGSAPTGQLIRGHPNVVARAVRVNVETDSLNAIVLGPDVAPESETFSFFCREVVSEMTVKAGQKCTAIRRVLVPDDREEAVLRSLSERLREIRVGDPRDPDVQMGPLVDRESLEAVRHGIKTLSQEAEIVYGDPNRTDFSPPGGYFIEPILFRSVRPAETKLVHEIEVFGPVATVMRYETAEDAIDLARKGGGSLVGSVFSEDESFIEAMAFRLGPAHGRLLLMNAGAAPESTGHGVVMPHLVHGGPGRAGGGEELGGLRSVYHFMQRVVWQGSPERLERLTASARME